MFLTEEKRTESEERDYRKYSQIIKAHEWANEFMFASPYTEEEIEEAMDYVDLLK